MKNNQLIRLHEYIDCNQKKHPYMVYGEENNGKDVDVFMPAYNHEKYIAQAIESVLAQKTTYSYRIIIGEDCSTDLTREIVVDYYNRYPDKITLILWEHNVGGSTNATELLKYADAEFVANLEGDDYWTYPFKLEKQISFLEKNSDFIGSGHNVRCVDGERRFLHRDFSLYPIYDEHIYGVENAKRFELVAQTASMVYRNIWKDMDGEQIEKFHECKANEDIKTSILLGLQGKLFFMRDIMADHRRVFVGDSWTARTAGRNLWWVYYNIYREIYNYIKEILGVELELDIRRRSLYENSRLNLMERVSLDNIRVWLKMYKEMLKYGR